MYRRRILALSLFLSLAFCIGLSAAHAEKAERQHRMDVGELFPDRTAILFEISPRAAASLFKGTGKAAAARSSALQMLLGELKDEFPFLAVPAFLELPWKSNIGIGWQIDAKAPVLAGELEGDAEQAISALVERFNLGAIERHRDKDDFRLHYIGGGRSFLSFFTCGPRVAFSKNANALGPLLETARMPEGPAFADRPSWALLDPMEPSTVARGVLDIEPFIEARPVIKQVLDLTGLSDLEALAYRLTLRGDGLLDEKVSVLSAGPFATPFALFSLSRPLDDADSVIPDTAAASFRLSFRVPEAGEWFTSFLQTIGEGGEIIQELGRLGFPDPADFFHVFADKLEIFFDYPPGVVLPEFVAALKLNDEKIAADVLALFAGNMSLPSFERAGTRFWYVPQKRLPPDFPWGVCLGIREGRLVVSSSADAVIAAFERAKQAPLVSSERYAGAFAGSPARRTGELYVDPAALRGLMRLLVLSKGARIEKAAAPSFEGIPPLTAVLTATDTEIELASRGPAVPFAAAWFAQLFGFGRNLNRGVSTTVKALENRMRTVYRMLVAFYRKKGRFPANLMEVYEENGKKLTAVLFTPSDARNAPDPLTPEFIAQKALFLLLPVPGGDPKAALAGYEKGAVYLHDEPPVLLSRRAFLGKFYTLTVRGKLVSVPGAQNEVKKLLDSINAWAGTSFSLSNGMVVK